jgi:hypothetical protein
LGVKVERVSFNHEVLLLLFVFWHEVAKNSFYYYFVIFQFLW